ncbi:MAG: hypothetical protein RID07_12600, partial [Lacipirellulaceae bacterium]
MRKKCFAAGLARRWAHRQGFGFAGVPSLSKLSGEMKMLSQTRILGENVDRRREAPTQRSSNLWLLRFHPDQVRKAP